MACRLSLDFDGTIVYNAYPKIGKLKPNVVEVIQKLYQEGYKIIISTCRAGIYEGHCYQFCKKHNIPYHFINSNLPEDIQYFGQDCRKISAGIYIDDKQLGGIPDDWNDIYNMIKEHELKFLNKK